MNLSTVFLTEAASGETHSAFGERILMLLRQQKRSKSWLAEQIGISKQALNYLLNHSAKPKFLNEMAAVLEVSPEWLKTGKGSFVSLATDSPVRKIPLFAMNAVGKKDEISGVESVIADSAYPCSCFSVKLENTSMEPTFNQGSILIFDPNKKPCSGDFIIFSVDATSQIFFRQYFSDGDDIYLKSADAMYKNFKNEKITIYGVLIESRSQFK